MTERDAGRVATACGFAGAAAAMGAILAAIALSSPETFTWRERALSDMGHYAAETFWLFNGGLVVGGALGVPFAWGLWTDARDTLERVGVALVLVSFVGMVGVGVFFLGHQRYYLDVGAHVPAAVTYFVVAPFAQWVYGSGAVRAGRSTLGLASIWLGIVHPLAWLCWLATRSLRPDPWAWFAVPEFLAALAFGIWIVALAADRRRRAVDELGGRPR